ncbi:hypothetical protein RO865_02220 [Blautia faecis]|jgi:hypothetical protein|uniref:hypothetical protein n=1 Tax=Blautia faecis TaxID=871665 RepID=UPI0028A3A156|nr:hypothetical protein [Blautia faecis]MDT4367654.1 hypothetical protein [Blautia faecis]
MYTSYNYYESGYLMGRDPKLSEDEFPLWEKQAERVLSQYTFSRLASNFGLITDEVKDCTCELAELLYQADKSAQQAVEQGGILQSYSNDGESGTFDLSQSTFTEEGKAKKTREIIYRYLGNTGLLYTGV